MSVSRDEVERIAGLARVELGRDEAESLRKDLNGILEHMETLARVGAEVGGGGEAVETGADGKGAAEQAHRQGPAPLREDGEITPDPLARPPEELAPRWEDGFFSVPRLPGLEEEETP